mmetsp:Transcript_2558/g.5389  ORF Transcript_2558/g.5389 Transcript_2558/m.5389 type:complete len:245 (-) Transcript_2558:160-894(-)
MFIDHDLRQLIVSSIRLAQFCLHIIDVIGCHPRGGCFVCFTETVNADGILHKGLLLAPVPSVGRLSPFGFVSVRNVFHNGFFGPLRLLFTKEFGIVSPHLLLRVLQLNNTRGSPGGDLETLSEDSANVFVGGPSGMFCLVADHHVNVRRIDLLAGFGVQPGERDHRILVCAELVFEANRWSVCKILRTDELVARRFWSVIGICAIGIPFTRFDLVFHKGLSGVGSIAAIASIVFGCGCALGRDR